MTFLREQSSVIIAPDMLPPPMLKEACAFGRGDAEGEFDMLYLERNQRKPSFDDRRGIQWCLAYLRGTGLATNCSHTSIRRASGQEEAKIASSSIRVALINVKPENSFRAPVNSECWKYIR